MPCFFLSYARADAGNDLTRLYRKLSDEVRRQSGEIEPVAFRDESSIETGAQWPQKIAEALMATSTFVPLYSPSYFTREYCGKEWAYFTQRISSESADSSIPPLIVPILWDSLDHAHCPTPSVAMSIQYAHEEFGTEYARYGLRYIMRLKEFSDVYEKFVRLFAKRLLEVRCKYPLEPATEIFPLERIASAFNTPADAVNALETQGSFPKGARTVQFLLIAGRADELKRVRSHVTAYGESSAEWMPCHPRHDHRIAPLIQGVAAEEGLMSHVVEYHRVSEEKPELRAQLDQAKENRHIILLVADNWSLFVDSYAKIAREFDSFGHYNATALVPWSQSDPEVAEREHDLTEILEATFENATGRIEDNPRLWVSDPADLREVIRLRLVDIRNRILAKSERRKLHGTGRSYLPRIRVV